MTLKKTRAAEALPSEAVRALELQSIGNTADAEISFRKALGKHPRDVRVRYALGAMLLQEKRLDEAEAILREAVKVQASHAESWYALGLVLAGAKRVKEALPCFERAVKIRPDLQSARHGLARALLEMKRLKESLGITEDMLRHTPDDFVAQGLAYNALNELREHARAEMLFKDISGRCPQSGSAWLFLGEHLTRLGKYDEAEAACGKSLEFLPNYSAAHLAMAMSLVGRGQFAEADKHIKTCLECAHDDLRELEPLLTGFIHRKIRSAPEPLCRRILALDPDIRQAKIARIVALELLGRGQEAAPLRKAAMEHFDRIAYEALICTATMHQSESPEVLLAHARAYGRSVLSENARKLAAGRTFKMPAKGGGRIRVGFVSHEVRDHSVAFFLEPVITHVNRDEFEVYLYSADPVADEMGKKLMAGADSFADLSALTPLEQARRIRKDNLDIAIDTTGYTEGCRLETFAQRVAPVQAHYIGYFGTSGLEHMDWFIGDRLINRPEDDRFFTEKIWRLPCFWTAWREKSTAPEIQWMPAKGGGITLGSFNALYKLGPTCLDVWGEIMLRLPASRLLLKNQDCADPAQRAYIRDTLERKGIAPERTVFMAATLGWREHMAAYDQVDLNLDPMPFNGCTTAFEALWMGVPMISLEGDWMGGRVGMAMLKALGHPEWVAETKEAYIAKAVALAENVELRRALRVSQREKMRAGPLCDYNGVARALEDAFRRMCGRV